MDIKTAREKLQNIIDETFKNNKLYNKDDVVVHINPTGKYVNHSSLHDSGLTGRKLIVDSFGGYSPIGGGAQSGKDYTKVDRSALYMARYIAKHIVASKASKKAIVQISYAIGIAKPLSVSVDTSGTYKDGLDDDKISKFVIDNFNFTPKAIIDNFKLDEPSKDNFMYADVAKKGQVGYINTPWEQLDALDVFKKLC
jgi:S-adenosylmethionine synthetase